MNKQRVYSPAQAATGAFLGGPLASVLCLHQNFRALANKGGERMTRVYGSAVLLLFLGILPFLPEKFPNMAIPLATVISTRMLVEKYQVTKQAVVESDLLQFHSNWRVFGLGMACLLVTFALLLAVIIGLDAMGVDLPD